MSTTPVIDVDRLTLTYGGFPAVKDLSFQLEQDPRDRAAVRPRMGIMLQESGFSPDLTVAETVRLIGRLTERTDDVGRVLGVVDLTRKAGTKVGQLSGGEKRRLVFLDEHTTGLDIQSRDALWDAVDRLREDGSTVVLTTHYLEEAQQRADRIGLMTLAWVVVAVALATRLFRWEPRR
jgi:ABC-2 type transport system ATP-binding protein